MSTRPRIPSIAGEDYSHASVSTSPYSRDHLKCVVETMRDIFNEIFENQPLDPTESARRNTRLNLRKRFYKNVSVGEQRQSGYPVLLDGRPIRTPARRPLTAPTPAPADALAAEWDAQKDVLDPARRPPIR